jgi:hypothetical protein
MPVRCRERITSAGFTFGHPRSQLVGFRFFPVYPQNAIQTLVFSYLKIEIGRTKSPRLWKCPHMSPSPHWQFLIATINFLGCPTFSPRADPLPRPHLSESSSSLVPFCLFFSSAGTSCVGPPALLLDGIGVLPMATFGLHLELYILGAIAPVLRCRLRIF